MKRKYIYPLVILLFTILPIIIDFSISHERHYPFIWSVFLIPSILIMFSYPNWKIIIGTGLFYTALKYTAELSQNLQLDFKDDAILLWSSLVNWAILLLVGYLRIQNEKLLNKIHCLALIDPLTDTYNRRYFDLYIQETVIDISKTGKQLLIIALDIDHVNLST
ncbi:GGDEF domain-containing protein [Domibacillus indicus]|uniref:GGDEF domain-containing protein n=1 Tax=Domibacillus indicus TaxID=1437523 RepID=UPI0020400D37|nr:GGDEF domain-containing protein [Domibacillus indicus]MCM3789971.1 GGDEF domain-containing protein [Domibacillus indicus]